MKRHLIALAAALCVTAGAHGAGLEPVPYSELVASIARPRAPEASGRHAVFTASGRARHVGIAFEHEGYRVIHSFKRIIRKDETGKPRMDASGKREESVLFYVAEIPEATSTLRYRMVIDGLWTVDPLNPMGEYDYQNGMRVSTLAVERYEILETKKAADGLVRFTCKARTGASITLAGTFNNWDPFMYEMEETAPGIYELSLPLPRGRWLYAYYDGMSQVRDGTNDERVYTKDGRVASVIVID